MLGSIRSYHNDFRDWLRKQWTLKNDTKETMDPNSEKKKELRPKGSNEIRGCKELRPISYFSAGALIGPVRYINIQAWLRDFMVKFHGSVLFSLSHKSQGRFLNKRIFKFNQKAS